MKKSIEEKNSIGKIVAFGNWKIKKEKIVGVHMHVSPKNSKKKKNYSKLQNCRNRKIIWRSENVRPKKLQFQNSDEWIQLSRNTMESVRDILLDKQRPTSGTSNQDVRLPCLDSCVPDEVYCQKRRRKTKDVDKDDKNVIFKKFCTVNLMLFHFCPKLSSHILFIC